LLLNVPSAHFLWLTTATILYLSGGLLGGRGHFMDFLRVTGVAMLAYPLIGALNYLHLLAPLPSLSLFASAFYSPNLGIGQLTVLLWMVAVGYHLQRKAHGLSTVNSALGAPLPVTVSLLLYLASAAFFFRGALLLPVAWTPQRLLTVANFVYLFVILALTLGMAAYSRRWLRMRRWLRR
jgi:hypothetical protein